MPNMDRPSKAIKGGGGFSFFIRAGRIIGAVQTHDQYRKDEGCWDPRRRAFLSLRLANGQEEKEQLPALVIESHGAILLSIPFGPISPSLRDL